MQLVEIQRGIDLREFLEDEYVTKGRRMVDIATDLGVDIGTVSRWSAHFGIARQRGVPA